MGLVDKILRAGEGKAVKQLAKIAQEVNAFENQITSLDNLPSSLQILYCSNNPLIYKFELTLKNIRNHHTQITN